MNHCGVIDFISKHQTWIVSIPGGIILIWKFIAKDLLHLETKSDRKRTIKSDMDIAKYLVDPSNKSHLVEKMAFESLTGKKASWETIRWLLDCHDPSTALEIYATAPNFIKIEDKNIQPVKWIEKCGNKIRWALLVLSLFIMGLVSVLLFYGTSILVELYETNLLNNPTNMTASIILSFFVIVDIFGLLWILSKVSSLGTLLAKIRRFYSELKPNNTIRK